MGSEMMMALWREMQAAEAPEVRDLGETAHTARKAHDCDTCKDTIHIGERYSRRVLVVDGDLTVSKYHDRPCRPRLW